MKNYIIRAMILIIIILMNNSPELFAQAPPVTTVGLSKYSGGTYSVPITVTGFQNTGNISLSLKYDNTRLVYSGMTLNNGLLSAHPVSTPLSDQSGTVRLSCTSDIEIILGGQADTLIKIFFTPKAGGSNGSIPLTWSREQGACDITPPVPGEFVPEITRSNMSTYFIDGFINIAPVPVISGPISVCPGSKGVVYTTEPGMTDYIWTICESGTITSGQGTNTIEVTWTSTPGSHSLSVAYTDPVAGPSLTPTVLQVEILTSCVKTLTITAFLEGLYAGNRTMRKAQCETGDKFTGDIADTVSIELHDTLNYGTIVYKATNLNISTTGQIVVEIPANFSGWYYLTLRHRNSIAVVSAFPITCACTILDYDFSTSASKTFGNNEQFADGVWMLYGGDINQDGFVGVTDMSRVDNLSAAFSNGYFPEDANGDGFVGVTDMVIIDNNSSRFIFVITP